MPSITLVPAYGRDYKNKKAVLEDLRAGKDFRVMDISSKFDGKYCSLRDFKTGDTLRIRYQGASRIIVYQVPALEQLPTDTSSTAQQG